MDKPILMGITLEVLYMIKQRTHNSPVKSAHIQQYLNISGVVVRKCIAELRVIHKMPICSGSRGYYFAPNKAHWDRTKAQLLSRAKELRKAATNPDEYFYDGEQSKMF
tara:strand:+ start:2798 stop:3121 length:324 start_codon:yes stop_codon:yes gene_type:complete